MSYRRPERVAWVLGDDGSLVYLSVMPSGTPLVLQGSAAVIWQAALQVTGDDEGEAAVVAAVADIYDVAPSEIEADVRTFLRDLLGRGLLAHG
jgi:hypothetical protein